ncbi:helix-turn-helix domain-containing protein [Flammeovirga yaeyamensis]|uniref:Helix-turn-helix domain-containing protein n=1 Tax=Flammeovirga yaeyamensis TaxID=367791 RepID=A0AAX1N6Q5_9BACT|nr:AraC family transcriptional regulator [Flammeovirga yaeyamensis]MBB3701095.1 YesN/AraC family two-component response regulator [Flammeovirga yaeyamensis]NMF38438.1 AraC family transcriptional regulator [Flammeovirga yaeyamensis]QWG01563.1 helix-turn-helix domain-containing protein [Flammeovirga yaeyamensis]
MRAKLEVIPKQVDESIHSFQFEETHFNAPWHYHNELELTYVLKSSGVRYIGNSIQQFQSGDLVLIGPSLPHAWKNAKNYDQGASSVYIQWNADQFNNHLKNIKEFSKIDLLLEKANGGIMFPQSKITEEIGEKMKSLNQLSDMSRLIVFLDVLHQLSELKDYSILSEPIDKTSFQKSSKRVDRIIHHIENHFQSPIQVDQMAELCCMTKSSFCKFFKNRFKKTFTQYLNEFRVHSICQELQETNEPITQIAMDCGYENMSYFHRQFKLIMGMTPAEYRRKIIEIS